MAAKFSTAMLALAWAACSSPAPETVFRPLVDDQHYPDVLTESRAVEPPPSLSGNRFLKGWFPWRHQDSQVFVPNAEGAEFQIVNLSDRGRSLIIESRLLGKGEDPMVAVEVAGIDLGRAPLATLTTLSLPDDLPRGRIPVQLIFDKEPDPVVLEASLDRALPPGKVEIEATSIVQAPSSMVDFTRPAEPHTRLTGRFSPPADPRPDQRFSIIVEDGARPSQTLFEWSNSWLDRFRGDRLLSLPLPFDSEFIRIRLVAEGTGSAAIWHDLGLATAQNESPVPETEVSREKGPAASPRIVVLYVLDALRADYLELAGGPDSLTPTLARLASEGAVFDRHQSVAPNTIPSTKSLFTGQAFLQRGHWKLAPEGPETLAEAFQSAGFRTGAFSGNGYISEAYGTARGFDHLADEVVFREYEAGQGTYNNNAEQVQRSALRWLDGLDKDDSAFLYLHTIHPHNPYDPPDPLKKRWTGDIDSNFEASTRNLLDVKHNRLEVSKSDQAKIAGLYKGALAYNDGQISEFLEELTRRYRPEEILLVVTSDHGEELFDHGGVLHGYTLYREQLHIPLILWWPGQISPQRIEAPTDNLDLHESLRALIGAESSVVGEGRPFWRLVGDRPPTQAPAHELRFAAASSVKGGIYMAQSERFKLIFAPRVGMTFGMGEGRGRGRDPEYLFDLTADPGEMVNLAGLTSLEVEWMRARLRAWIERGKYLEMDEEEPVLDDETQARLRALGYLE